MPSSTIARTLAGHFGAPLKGQAIVPGDKSISHRALILGALAAGETRISGLLEAEDVLNTAHVMGQLGATITHQGPGAWTVRGVGRGGFSAPDGALDFGNSGTGSRLVMGAIATTPLTALFTGDESLCRRPMGRVFEPLALFGTETKARDGGLMPLTIIGAGEAKAVDYTVRVASAQVKSAMLLAALNAAGKSRITQHALTRDHTERMLRAFGADIVVAPLESGGEIITLTGKPQLVATPIAVPRDPSSAAFAMVAALIVPGSEISLPGILLNPRRIGLFDTLKEMGADIETRNVRESGGETIGDLVVRSSALKGVEVPAERAPAMIDEYPILGVAAAFASGRTIMRGLEELRVKESDRLAAIVAGLRANGVRVEELEDGMIVEGMNGVVPGGGMVATHMDHRIAMSFLVMGLGARAAVAVDDVAMIATSFPEFEDLMRGLGGVLK